MVKVLVVREPLAAELRPGFKVTLLPGQWAELEPAAAEDLFARDRVLIPGRQPVDWWAEDGRVLAAEPLDRPEAELCYTRAPLEGSLRIVQGCAYDPGQAAYRFHSALNEASKHASAFVRFGHTNPFFDLAVDEVMSLCTRVEV